MYKHPGRAPICSEAGYLAGASKDVQDQDGYTCIMLAAQKNSPKALSVLIGHSASVFLTCWDGSTALHMAARDGFDECIQILLAAGSVVGAEDIIGNTPVLEASRAGHLTTLKVLLKAGGKCSTGALLRLVPAAPPDLGVLSLCEYARIAHVCRTKHVHTY
jgi:ankyrin repeat protein